MKFGLINNYLLFGGGDLLLKIALYLKSRNYGMCVITSERHFSEKLKFLNECTLGESLEMNSIKYLISEKVSEDDRVIGYISKSTIGLSFGAAWIFKKKFIDLFKGKLLNLHGSRLPFDGGGGGFSWRIMRGDKLGISLIHQIQPGIDTGDIIDYENYVFPQNCKIPVDFYKISNENYFEFMKSFLMKIDEKVDFSFKAQPEYLSMYWPRLNTDVHGYINWFNNVDDIDKFICAFDDPYDGAITYLNGNEVRIKKVASMKTEGIFHPFQSGIIYRVNDGIAMVAANSGALIIKEIFNENRENIIFSLRIGDRLYTPSEKIENAFRHRAIYTPSGVK